MKVSDFDFELPDDLIAQTPLNKRATSKLMVLNRQEQSIEHKHFYDIIDHLNKGDVLVRNNTKVIPARVFGIKKETGGNVEILLLKELECDIWECLVGNARIVKIGTVITLGNDDIQATCVSIGQEGIRVFKMSYTGIFLEILEQLGTMPLPPYIKETLEQQDRYQTVYAKVSGSAAAPTAGLHFTDEVIEKLTAKGVMIVDVTLHVGLGTFRPVKVDDVFNHKMHSEMYIIEQNTADILNKAKDNNQRIISVGTTSTRVLESNINKYGKFTATKEETDIFIYPGYSFKAIDALITNFHLPKSTLLMLISAFYNKEHIMQAYNEAVSNEYRFFSFGDSMFIE